MNNSSLQQHLHGHGQRPHVARRGVGRAKATERAALKVPGIFAAEDARPRGRINASVVMRIAQQGNAEQ